MQKRPVYISSWYVTAPGIYGTEAFSDYLLYGKESRAYKKINFDTTNRFYPQRSDLKSMREDVIASVIAVYELLDYAGISLEVRENIALFTSTGMCIGEIAGTINKLKQSLAEENGFAGIKQHKTHFYDAIPPLTALRTLTNSLESYVSLYTGLAGENTTFGGTSAGGFYALQEAYNLIANNKQEMAVAGSGNVGDTLTEEIFRNFQEDSSGWKSGSCAAFLLLESAESIKNRNAKALAEITKLEQSTVVPSLFNKHGSIYDQFLNNNYKTDFCVFGGGNNHDDYIKEKHATESLTTETFSLFPLFGNTASTSVFMSLAASLAKQKHQGFKKSICLEKDVYEREFLVELNYGQLV